MIFEARPELVWDSEDCVAYVLPASDFDRYVFDTLVLNPFRFCSSVVFFASESDFVSYVWLTLALNPFRSCSTLVALERISRLAV